MNETKRITFNTKSREETLNVTPLPLIHFPKRSGVEKTNPIRTVELQVAYGVVKNITCYNKLSCTVGTAPPPPSAFNKTSRIFENWHNLNIISQTCATKCQNHDPA